MTSSIANIDPAAISANVVLLGRIAGDAVVCAVVKADGYGHGAVTAARAALDGGAAMLAVARVHEARDLRAAGIDAPLLVLSELDLVDVDAALAMGLELVVYQSEVIDAVGARAVELGVPAVGLHLKVDTGMRRVGCVADGAVALAARIVAHDRLRLAGTMTHLACADAPTGDAADPTTAQLDAFDAVLADLATAGIDPGTRHAANSAGTIVYPRARYDMVRVGISMYGIPPAPDMDAQRYPVLADLRPALRWTAAVGFVKAVAAGDKVSYGHRHQFIRDTVVATVPVGYADGVRRNLGLAGGAVLIGGRRCPIVGVVTMDQLMVDCGPAATVTVGDEVVLVGGQGDERVTVDDWATSVGTISYEIVCGISTRVERQYR